MKNKNINLAANKLVNAFLKNKIISPISSNYSKYDKIRLNAHKYAKKYNIDWRMNKLLLF